MTKEVKKTETRQLFHKIDILPAIIYAVTVILPYASVKLLLASGTIHSDVAINPTIISGLITLSGILFGFATHTAVSRNAPAIMYVFLFGNILIFYYLAVELFFAAIGIGSWLMTLTWSVTSMLSNFMAAGGVLSFDAFYRFKKRS